MVCDNYVSWGKELVGEHGFSALLETDEGELLLFDAGQGKALLQNAKALGVPLGKVHTVVLSHGHFDHTGGLRDVLLEAPSARVLAHPDAFSPKYDSREGQTTFIGIPYSLEAVKGWARDVVLAREPVEVLPGVFTTGEVRGERLDKGLMVKTPRGLEPDPLLDDLSLVVDRPQGLVVVLGCAHAGVVAILEHIEAAFGKRPISLILGGMHLQPLQEEEKKAVLDGLKRWKIEALAVGHCTGAENLPLVREVMGKRALLAHVGMTWEV